HAIELWAQYGTHLWWRLLVAPFTYTNTGYAIVALGTIAGYGWLLERRDGPVLVLVLFAIAAVGGAAVTAADSSLPLALGANGGALALLIAWAIPGLRSLRAGGGIDGDRRGTAAAGGGGRAPGGGGRGGTRGGRPPALPGARGEPPAGRARRRMIRSAPWST